MNMKVTLVHEDAPESMKRLSARVIDGNLLNAQNRAGREMEAKAIYNKMMGIKSTRHPYEVIETEEPPYTPPEIPKSEAAKYEETKEEKVLARIAGLISAGIASGIAQALATKKTPDEVAGEITQAAGEEVSKAIADADTEGPMRSKPRR